jgi:hypothetical protein
VLDVFKLSVRSGKSRTVSVRHRPLASAVGRATGKPWEACGKRTADEQELRRRDEALFRVDYQALAGAEDEEEVTGDVRKMIDEGRSVPASRLPFVSPSEAHGQVQRSYDRARRIGNSLREVERLPSIYRRLQPAQHANMNATLNRTLELPEKSPTSKDNKEGEGGKK